MIYEPRCKKTSLWDFRPGATLISVLRMQRTDFHFDKYCLTAGESFDAVHGILKIDVRGRRLSTISKIFSSETARLIKAKLHVEHS